MDNTFSFDYFYGGESEQFSYYRIPRVLITGEQFRSLSTDAKLLYGLMLDRMGLSTRNGWYDRLGRVYIYYTLDEIQENMNCGHNKGVKLLAELDCTQGIGLIERIKQGQGRPTKIYVKQFTTKKIPPASPPTEHPPSQGTFATAPPPNMTCRLFLQNSFSSWNHDILAVIVLFYPILLHRTQDCS